MSNGMDAEAIRLIQETAVKANGPRVLDELAKALEGLACPVYRGAPLMRVLVNSACMSMASGID